MNILEHAECELRKAGLFDTDSDYAGGIGEAVMGLMREFAGKGHSGGSAMMTLAAFDRVARWQTLTPITDDPAEWMDVAELCPGTPGEMWQNRRDPSMFSTDGGKMHYCVDDEHREIRASDKRKP